MVHYTVLVPLRDKADSIGPLLGRLEATLDELLLPYELICIDDGSVPSTVDQLQRLLYEHPALRVLRFDEPRGTSAAIGAGLAAARGRIIMALQPDALWAADQLPQLISRLSQLDFVYVHREQSPGAEMRGLARHAARALARDARLHADDELLWAARRGAVVGISLARGAFRWLPALVARRGFRVGRVVLAEGLPPRGQPFHLGIVGRPLAGWLNRRFEPHLALEMVRAEQDARWSPSRASLPQARFVPQAVFSQADKDERHPA